MFTLYVTVVLLQAVTLRAKTPLPPGFPPCLVDAKVMRSHRVIVGHKFHANLFVITYNFLLVL